MTYLSSVRSFRRLLLALGSQVLALAICAPGALALDSGWAETEGGRMRLVINPAPREDGAITGVLDIDLQPGWKTYWRDPGGSGIPPMLDLSASKGIALEDMLYPPPVRVDDGYAVWAGYTAPVRLPVVLRRQESGGGAQIRASAFIGICEKICIPFQADLAVDIPAKIEASDADKAIVDEAFARLPSPPTADFFLAETRFDPDAKTLSVSANLPAFRPSGASPELFVAGPPGYAFAPPRLLADEGGKAEWTVHIEGIPASANPDNSLDLVVTLGQRAITQTIPASR